MIDIDKARAIPDDSPIFDGVPQGETRLMDGIMYVRHSDWLPFLRLIWEFKTTDACPF